MVHYCLVSVVISLLFVDGSIEFGLGPLLVTRLGSVFRKELGSSSKIGVGRKSKSSTRCLSLKMSVEKKKRFGLEKGTSMVTNIFFEIG